MKHLPRTLALAAFVAFAGCSSGQSNPALPASPLNEPGAQLSAYSRPALAPASMFGSPNVVHSCASLVPAGWARCGALRRTDIVGEAAVLYGYHPADIHLAYNIPNIGGSDQTIGIVDAYDDPSAESDLAIYRKRFGLSSCTTSDGCFRKLNEEGQQGHYPASDADWGAEISLDLDMASAVCPACHIVLVESHDNSFVNLGRSVDVAVAEHADVVSNSYYGTEDEAVERDYEHPGHVILAASGDGGFSYGPTTPSSFASVVAVGGTSLYKSSNPRGWIEWAWYGAGSGCSAIVAKPAWQTDKGCTMRTESDISAIADPETGVTIFDTFGLGGSWFVYGGTSAATPIIASMFALAGHAASQHAAEGIWNDRGRHLYDIVVGNNGTCSPTYLCTASRGYDGPTGWGTPNGLVVFQQ